MNAASGGTTPVRSQPSKSPRYAKNSPVIRNHSLNTISSQFPTKIFPAVQLRAAPRRNQAKRGSLLRHQNRQAKPTDCKSQRDQRKRDRRGLESLFGKTPIGEICRFCPSLRHLAPSWRANPWWGLQKQGYRVMKFVSLRRRVHRRSTVNVSPYKRPETFHKPPGASHEIHTYAELRQQIHDDLRMQHPEWVEPGGESPICDRYEARLREVLENFTRRDSAQAIVDPHRLLEQRAH